MVYWLLFTEYEFMIHRRRHGKPRKIRHARRRWRVQEGYFDRRGVVRY